MIPIRSPRPTPRQAAAFGLGLAFVTAAALVAGRWYHDERPALEREQLRDSARDYAAHGQWKEAATQWGALARRDATAADALEGAATAQLQRLEEAAGSRGGNDEVAAGRLRLAVARLRQLADIDPAHRAAQRWLLEYDLRTADWGDLPVRRAAVAAAEPSHPLLPLADAALAAAAAPSPETTP